MYWLLLLLLLLRRNWQTVQWTDLSCLLNTADMYADVDLCGLLRWIDVCALLWSNLEGDTQLAECWAERQDTTGDQTRYVQVCSVGSARGAHGGCFRRLMTSHDVMTCLAVCHMTVMYLLLISHTIATVSVEFIVHMLMLGADLLSYCHDVVYQVTCCRYVDSSIGK